MHGKGSMSITNGEFHTLDILGQLSEIAELALLGRFKYGAMRFNDVRADFQVEDKKVGTENLLLISDDFQIEAAGDLNFESNLNFRLSVYLTPMMSQRVSSRIGEDARLGPIPLLVVGPITEPSIRQDPLLINTFLGYLAQSQFSKITSRFAPSRYAKMLEPPERGTAASSLSKNDKGEPQSMEQLLFESGFNLLEEFLSEKKTS